MAKVGISEASKLTEKSRQTLYRHIKKGKLSVEKDNSGSVVVDISELHRVYGPLSGEAPIPVTRSDAELQSETETLRHENERLRRELEDVKRDARERERAHLAIIHEMAQVQMQLTAGAKKSGRKGSGWMDRLLGRD